MTFNVNLLLLQRKNQQVINMKGRDYFMVLKATQTSKRVPPSLNSVPEMVQFLPIEEATWIYCYGGLDQGSPTPGPQPDTGPQPVRNQAIQASKAPSIHVWDPGSAWNHTDTQSAEKPPSTEPVPDSQKVGAAVLNSNSWSGKRMWRWHNVCGFLSKSYQRESNSTLNNC